MALHSFDPVIAKKVGTNAAVIYQNIVWWIEKNKANGKHEYEGRFWTYNSVSAFHKLFQYMTKKQIRTALEKLLKASLIEKGNFNQIGYDRTLWYCLSGKDHLPKMANGNAPEGEPIPDIKPDSNNPPPPYDVIDPKLGSFHYMTKGEKYSIPEKFYPGQDIKDYALIDLRIYSQEYRDIIVNFAEYWRDKARTTRGKKTPRGWKAALRTWLNREAVSLKAKWRDKPFDYRDKEKAGSAAVPDDVSEYPSEYWEMHVRRYSDQGDWSAIGPNPDSPDCLAPENILKKYDF